jgi:hypothetical protein
MRCSIMKVLVGGSLALIPAMCSAQEPIKVTPCDLVTTPEKYSGKFVQVTGRVYLAFEDFSLAQPGCEDAYPGVWLVYGGDAPTPTKSTVNDNFREPGSVIDVNGIPIPLVQDAALALFRQRLGAMRETSIGERPCYNCYLYRVTAALTGVFFAANGKSMPLSGGYGHLGCCNLLAIERVANVNAERTVIPMGGKFKCSSTKRELTVSEAQQLQALDAPCGTVGYKKCDELRAQQLVAAASFVGNSIRAVDGDVATPDGSDHSTKYGWESIDKLRAYSLIINSPDPTKADSKATGGLITRTTCTDVHLQN